MSVTTSTAQAVLAQYVTRFRYKTGIFALMTSSLKKQGRNEKKVASVKNMFSYASEMMYAKNQTGTPCLQTLAQILQIRP